MPTFGSLFAGIGGIDLGLERAGWECRFQVEWDEFCQRVLAQHWPDVPRFGDIHDVHGPLAHGDGDGRPGRWQRGTVEDCGHCLPRVDLLAGGFPCQPFSFAGKRQTLGDDRWLWPEFARAIRELRPRYVLVENVPGLLVGGGMGAVLGDLATLGYDAEWESIPAAAVGAPHLRYRVWIIGTRRAELGRDVADSDDGRPLDAVRAGRDAAGDGGAVLVADADSQGPQGRPVQPQRAGQWTAGASGMEDAPSGRRERRGSTPGQEGGGWTLDLPAGSGEGDERGWWESEPDVGRVAHGVPARVDRLRSLGNAVVPQVVEMIGRAILAQESAA